MNNLLDPALVEDLFFNKIETLLINFHSFQKMRTISPIGSVFLRSSIKSIDSWVVATNKFIDAWVGEEAQDKIISCLIAMVESEEKIKDDPNGIISYSTRYSDARNVLELFIDKIDNQYLNKTDELISDIDESIDSYEGDVKNSLQGIRDLLIRNKRQMLSSKQDIVSRLQ